MIAKNRNGMLQKLITMFQGPKEGCIPTYKVSLKTEPMEYQIICNGIVLGHTTFQPEVDVFLINNRIKPGTDAYQSALEGKPFTADGVTTRFIRIDRS